MTRRTLSMTIRGCTAFTALTVCVACNQTDDVINDGLNTTTGTSTGTPVTQTTGTGGASVGMSNGFTASGGFTATTGIGSTQSGVTGGTVSVTGNGGSTATAATEPTLIGDVAFSTPSQSFKEAIEVGMTTPTAGAEIRYTVDGTLPSSSSKLYQGSAITLTATTQVRAQAFVGGAASGAVSTAIYIARTIDPTSDIPIMIVDDYGNGQPCDKNVDFDAAVMIWEPVNGVASMASLPTLVARAGMHVRGQSSVTFAQTPYKVELWDNNNKDLDYPVLGMPADSDWALIPPYYDRTLLRNPFTFALGKDMGMEAPRNEFAEVYINLAGHSIGDADYQGIYWVTETIKNNKVRTNLKSLKETDTELPKIGGGYIFKFDQMAAEEPKLTCTGANPLAGMSFGGGGNAAGGFDWKNFDWGGGNTTTTTPTPTSGCSMAAGSFSTSTGTAGTCWIDLEVVEPDPLNAQQKVWLTTYIQEFHDSLHKTPIGDYAQYIDVPSFIDYMLISEITLNVDAYTKSAYYFKDRDQKIKAGPLWDYNFALGGVGAMSATPQSTSETGWRYSGNRDVNHWYPMLTSDAKFMAQVKERYSSLRKTLLSNAAIEERLNTMSAPLKKAVVRDYARWPVSSVISNSGFFAGPTAPTWEEQLKVMRDFILARLTWMDSNLK